MYMVHSQTVTFIRLFLCTCISISYCIFILLHIQLQSDRNGILHCSLNWVNKVLIVGKCLLCHMKSFSFVSTLIWVVKNRQYRFCTTIIPIPNLLGNIFVTMSGMRGTFIWYNLGYLLIFVRFHRTFSIAYKFRVPELWCQYSISPSDKHSVLAAIHNVTPCLTFPYELCL